MTGSFSETFKLGADFFEFEPRKNLELSIELSLDGFSFLVKEGDALISLQKYVYQGNAGVDGLAKDLSILFDLKGLKKGSYGKVRVAYHSGSLVIIPKEVFDQSQINKYYHFCEPANDKELLFKDNLDAINCIGIFGFPVELELVLNSFFHGYELNNAATTIINSFTGAQALECSDEVLIFYLRSSNFDIFWFKNSKLMFYNSFACRELDDYLYFMMLTLEQLQIDASNTNSIILGDCNCIREFSAQAKNIFRNLQQLNPISHIQNTGAFNNEDYHRFFSLLNI